MANDNLRSGPAGATDQAPALGPRVESFVIAADANVQTAGNDAFVDLMQSNNVVTEADFTAVNTKGFLFAGTGAEDTWGGEWVIEKIWLVCSTPHTGANMKFKLGLYACQSFNNDAAHWTPVDDDAIIKEYEVASSSQAVAGQIYEIYPDGDLAGVSVGTVGGNSVVGALGSGNATNTAGGASVAGQSTVALFDLTVAAGTTGKSRIFCQLKPVGGPSFKK
jgi:hypothetical protein